VPATLLLIALTYAAIAHGAFHAGELLLLTMLIGIALALAFVAHPPRRSDLGAPTLAAAALAAWYVVAAAIDGHVAGAGPAVAVLFAAAAGIAVARRAADDEREMLLVGVLVIGGVVAATGWFGVAFHHQPWAIPDNGLWRAASTITYANATGGLVGALALVALDRVLVAQRRAHAVLAFVLVVGLAATTSRGALVAFAIGLVVLGVIRRRAGVHQLLPPLLGASVAFAALLPSLPDGNAAHPVVAILGLVVGAAVALAPTRLALGLAAACVLVGLVPAGFRHDARAAWNRVSTERVTAGSDDRGHERRAGLQLVRDHPLTGVGPGQVTLRWRLFLFVPVEFTVHYAHDEYLQVATESGVIGLAIAVVGIGFVLEETRRRAQAAPRSFATAGIAAALVMLAAHSATDFLWHVPIVPVAVSVLLGVITLRESPRSDAMA